MGRKIFILWFIVLTVTTFAQKQTQYNVNGDEAMKRFDYSDAIFWYGEGIADCNSYSIGQLTKIWTLEEPRRSSMSSLMGKCLACLSDKATETKDTASINLLILYYTEGIGTPVNDNTANFWREQFGAITSFYSRNIDKPVDGQQSQSAEKQSKVDLFAGYSANTIAPVGLTFGVVGKNVGGYLRYRTNLSFQDFTETCDGDGIVKGTDGYSSLGNKKANATVVTGGLVFKPAQQFFISIGGGYWKRDLIHEFEKTDLTVTEKKGTFWAKNEDFSYSGFALDLDGIYRAGKIFYISAGCSLMNFKYASGNVGIGVFF